MEESIKGKNQIQFFENADIFQQKYELEQKAIGLSGSGKVYKGIEKDTGLHYAIKIIEIPEQQGLFEKLRSEIKKLVLVPTNANIIEIKEYHLFEAQSFMVQKKMCIIVMDLADTSLEQNIQENDEIISNKTFITYLEQSLKGLQHLNDNGIFHKNIKPINLLIKGEILKLTDFGISDIDYDGANKLQISSLVGTPAYLSPQINQNFKSGQMGKIFFANEKSDVFSLGISFLRLMLNIKNESEISGINEQSQKLSLSILLQKIENQNCRYILENMTNFDENKRWGLKQCLDYLQKIKNSVNNNQKYISDEEKAAEIQFGSLKIQDVQLQNNLNDEAKEEEEIINPLYEYEQEVEKLFRDSYYEKALKVVEELGDQVWSSLKLITLYMVLLEKIAYHEKMGRVMKKARDRDDEFRQKYLNHPNISMKKLYYNYKREAIWDGIQSTVRREIMNKLLQDCKNVFGEKNSMVALVLYQLGKIEMSAKKYDETQVWFNKSIEMFDSIEKTKKNMMDKAFVLKYYGNVHIYQKQYKQAEQKFLQESVIWEEIAHKNHGEYGNSLQNRSICNYYNGKYQIGYEQLKQALDIFLKSFGDKNQYYSAGLSWMVVFCKKLNMYQDGGKYSIKAQLLFLDTLGEKHQHYINNSTNLADNFSNYQKDLTGRIQIDLIDRFDKYFKKEEFKQGNKYLTIAMSTLDSAKRLKYIKADQQPKIDELIKTIKRKKEIVKFNIAQTKEENQ